MAAAARTAKKADVPSDWKDDDDKKKKDQDAAQKADVDIDPDEDDDEDEDGDDDSYVDDDLDEDVDPDADDEDEPDEDDDDDDEDNDLDKSEDDEDDDEDEDDKKDDEDEISKSDDDDEMSCSEDPADDKDTCDMTKKSAPITEQTLSKALAVVNRFYEASDPSTRRQALLSKASTGELSKSERRELYKSLGGRAERRPSLARKVAKSFKESPTMAKAMHSASQEADVSEYLEAQTDNLCKGLRTVARAQDTASERQHQATLIMCKALAQIGGTVLAMGRKLDVIEKQPVREPRSISARPLNKSFAGEPSSGAEQAAEPQEMIETLTEMNRESHANGRSGLSKSQHSISDAVNALLSSGALPRGIVQDVREFRKSQRARA